MNFKSFVVVIGFVTAISLVEASPTEARGFGIRGGSSVQLGIGRSRNSARRYYGPSFYAAPRSIGSYRQILLPAPTMDIVTAITRLRSLGLYVDRHVPGGMTDRELTDGLTIARELRDGGGLAVLVDPCFVFPARDGWAYRNWHGIGVHLHKSAQDSRI